MDPNTFDCAPLEACDYAFKTWAYALLIYAVVQPWLIVLVAGAVGWKLGRRDGGVDATNAAGGDVERKPGVAAAAKAGGGALQGLARPLLPAGGAARPGVGAVGSANAAAGKLTLDTIQKSGAGGPVAAAMGPAAPSLTGMVGVNVENLKTGAHHGMSLPYASWEALYEQLLSKEWNQQLVVRCQDVGGEWKVHGLLLRRELNRQALRPPPQDPSALHGIVIETDFGDIIRRVDHVFINKLDAMRDRYDRCPMVRLTCSAVVGLSYEARKCVVDECLKESYVVYS